MLVECPKCHFQQPKDQYCANCGVDMIAFRPAKKPFVKTLIGNSLFQLITISMIGVSVAIYVNKTDQPQKWIQKINTFSSTRAQTQQTTTAPTLDSSNSTEAQSTQDSSLSESENTEFKSLSSNEASTRTVSDTLNTVSQTEISNNSKISQVTASVHATLSLKILELDNETTNLLIKQMLDNNKLLVDSDIKAGLVKDFDKITSQKSKNLKSENLNLIEDESYLLWLGNNAQDDAEKKGLLLSFDILKSADNPTNILKFLLDKFHPNSPTRIPIITPFEKNQTLIVIGNSILSYFEFEPELSRIAPYQIFKSTDFKNQKTTFIISVEFKN